MKHPFWIVNSILLFLVIIALAFMFMSRVEIPEREDIKPRKYSAIAAEHSVQINISKIYENDLFGTYQRELPQPDLIDIPPLPTPPEPTQATIPPTPKPQFLDPLDINLKGITILGSDPSKTRAIIADNKTQREVNYKVGDNIEDGQLIRIFSNKVVILRANGQQEVLYLREQDAKKDPLYSLIDEWNKVVTVDGSKYILNIKEFAARVKSLAQLIDLVDLTTAYKNGQNAGCRIGQLPEKSFGTYIGLQSGDIITKINDIETTSLDNRLKIYKKIVGMRNGDTIQITLLRKKQELTLTIVLKDPSEIQEEETIEESAQPAVITPKIPEPKEDEIAAVKTNIEDKEQPTDGAQAAKGAITVLTNNQKQQIAQQGTRFKPVVNRMQLDEKQYMLAHGKKPTHLL